jgi:hypothetical protein
MRRGSRGTVLESAFICGKRYTSKEAISRFVLAQLHVASEQPPLEKRIMSKKDMDAARRKYKLPVPLKPELRQQ